ncbi:unnamed protein product [Cylicocyclus nassatus]|uniref:Uncharacterized protein n=1 Tax=Cylicocyclus nassatus TaxID=53992 RepID=A0AA36H4G0_CYLNA|nr:unnamed protein product [Cylicocyclus nassatus]
MVLIAYLSINEGLDSFTRTFHIKELNVRILKEGLFITATFGLACASTILFLESANHFKLLSNRMSKLSIWSFANNF